MNKKDKKNSGRVIGKIIKPKMKYDEIKKEALEPEEFYDDWEDYRDGMRDISYKEWKEKDKKKRPRYKRGGSKRCQK